MAEIRARGRVRRLGNRIAIMVPARDARRGNIGPGETVELAITTSHPGPLGYPADRPYVEYQRDSEGVSRDRV